MQEHLIQPSFSQLDQWERQAKDLIGSASRYDESQILKGFFGTVHRKALCLAYAAGADQELEACCEWLDDDDDRATLREARRPKPPSLKQQALDLVSRPIGDGFVQILDKAQADIIRRAIESLPD